MPSKLPTTTEARAAHLRAQGAAVAAARHHAGLTQREAAEWLGVSVWTLRSWEQGLRQAPPEVRHRIFAEWAADARLLDDACPHCRRPW